MADSDEIVPSLPSQFAEICATLTMRCQKCDGMTDLERAFFLDNVKNARLCLNLIAKALCEFHPISHWALFIWDRITSADATDKEILMKYMIHLGRASPNLSVFNLWIGCPSVMSFFRKCTMPQTVPSFASQSLLSRPCNTSVSWEKIMLKLKEALDVDALTEDSLLRATLACRMLLLVEATEKSPVLRLKDEGKRLVNEVSPCPLPVTKAWPASSMCFYVIFGWMKRTHLVEQAMEEFIQSNLRVAKHGGVQLVSVTLATPDVICVESKTLSPTCGHYSKQKCAFDYSSGVFPIAKGCLECTEHDDESNTFDLVATPKLLQVMTIMKMACAYLLHNNSGELHRDSLLACMLYILLQGVPSKAKEMNRDGLVEVYQKHFDNARKTAPGTIVPPVAACDYRTPEGRHKRRKQVKHKTFMRISWPTEKKTIQTYVEDCRKCEELHSKTPSLASLVGACDAVVESLLKKDATSFDITLEMIPRQMWSLESSRRSETSGVKRKCEVLLDSDDDGDDKDAENVTCPPNQSSTSPITRPGQSTMDNRDHQPWPKLSQRPMPITLTRQQPKEKVVLQSRKPFHVPSQPDQEEEEQEQSDTDNNDDDDSYSRDSDDSDSDSGSGSDSDKDNETERGLYHLRRSLRSTECQDGKGTQVAAHAIEMDVQQSSPLSSRSTEVVNLDPVIPRSTNATTSFHESQERQASPSNVPRQRTASVDPTEGRQASTPPKVQERRSLSFGSSNCMPSSQSSEPTSSSAGPSKTTNVVASPAKLQAANSSIKASTSQSVGPMEPYGVASELTALVASLDPCTPFVPPSSLELSDTRLTTECADEAHSPVSNLFDGITNSDFLVQSHYHDADVLRKTLGDDELQPLDPVPSEIISNGGVVKGRGQTTIGPVQSDTLRRGKCLATLLRDGGDLKEVVPTVEATLTANGEFAFNVSTEIVQLYSLDTFPGEWTELKNFPQIARTLFMAAGLQALNPNDLSSFPISVDGEMVWLPPKTGRVELDLHPLELLQHSPTLGRKLRTTVRADTNFGSWARNIADTKRRLMENVVREADLLIKDSSRTIDLDYFGRFFNRLIAVLPWMQAL